MKSLFRAVVTFLTPLIKETHTIKKSYEICFMFVTYNSFYFLGTMNILASIESNS